MPAPQPCGVYIGPAYDWSSPLPTPGLGEGFPPAGLFVGDCLGPLELELRVYDANALEAFAIDFEELIPDFWDEPVPPWVKPTAVWVFAEEYGPMLPAAGPMYAAVPPDLDGEVGVLSWDGVGLVDDLRTIGAEGGPSHRTEFAAALSARDKTLWVGGGTSLGGDATDVWALALYGDPSRWRLLVDLHGHLSRVDGLAYDPYSHRVMAVGPSADSLEVRVVAIDPATGAATIHAAWGRSPGTADVYDVAAAGHETLYVSAASPTHYKVVRVDGQTGQLTGYDPSQNGGLQTGALVRGTMTARNSGVFLMVEDLSDQAFRVYMSADMVPLTDPSSWF